jgi:hypothetical protein
MILFTHMKNMKNKIMNSNIHQHFHNMNKIQLTTRFQISKLLLDLVEKQLHQLNQSLLNGNDLNSFIDVKINIIEKNSGKKQYLFNRFQILFFYFLNGTLMIKNKQKFFIFLFSIVK